MSRVTAEEVREIIELDEGQVLTPFMDVAHELVEAVCVSSILTESLKKEIERWLSAHFAAVADPRSADESAGKVSIKYQVKLGLDLRVTHWGQQALVLDISGALANLGIAKKVVSMKYIGGNVLP